MFSREHKWLKDNDIMPHMMAFMHAFSLQYDNSNACYSKFGAVRTPYLMHDELIWVMFLENANMVSSISKHMLTKYFYSDFDLQEEL